MKIDLMAMMIVGLGGFIGAIARYGTSEFAGSVKLPYGTLIVNVLGCFIMGFILFHQLSSGGISEEWRLFLCVGILGAFTTMSAFSAETFAMLEQKEVAAAFLNIILNVFGSIIAVFLGRSVAMLSYFSAV